METCRLPVSLTGGRPLPLPTGAVPGTDAVGGYLFWLGYVMVCPSSSLSFSKLGDSVFTFFVFPIILIIHHKLDDNYWQSNKYNPLIQLGMKLDLWVQQHREYRVWQKKNQSKQKNKLENQNQGKNKKTKIKQKSKPAFSTVFVFLLLLFFVFFFVFLFFSCFFWWFFLSICFFGDSVFVLFFLLKSTFSVLHGVIKLDIIKSSFDSHFLKQKSELQ